jgi:hypothetical protein
VHELDDLGLPLVLLLLAVLLLLSVDLEVILASREQVKVDVQIYVIKVVLILNHGIIKWVLLFSVVMVRLEFREVIPESEHILVGVVQVCHLVKVAVTPEVHLGQAPTLVKAIADTYHH